MDKLIFLGRLTGGVAAMVAVAWIVGLVRELSAAGYGGQALDVDFAVFWGAAKLTLADGPLVPFDLDRLNAARALPAELQTFPMLWLYPPGWLAIVLPLGLLPFIWAWAVFAGLSFAGFAWALRAPARALPGLWPLMLAAPVVLLTLALGQTSLVFAGLLVLAIEAIRRDRAILAGLAIAAMTLKPQLGLAIPVALLAGGYWRVILWAIIGTVAILATSLLWPGLEYWPLFFTAMEESVGHMRASLLPAMMVTGYGLATMAGLDHGPALGVQIACSLAAMGGLGWLWASRAAFDLKAAGLALAVLLVTPYAIYYELVFAVVGVVYLARAGRLASRPGQALAAAIWLAPVFGFLLLQGPGFSFAAPLIALAFGLSLIGGLRHPAPLT